VRLTALLLLCLSVAACVSETYYADSDKPVAVYRQEKDQVAGARVSLAMKYLQNGNMEQAKGNLIQALEAQPDNPGANYGMAYYYQVVKEQELALSYYDKAVRFDPDNGHIRNGYGAYLCELGRYSESEKEFLAAVNSKSYHLTAETYENLGTCAKLSGDMIKAEQYFERAFAHNPNRARAQLELARIALSKDDVAKAEALLDSYHQRFAPSADSAFLGVRLANMLHDPLLMQKYGDILTNQFPASQEAADYMLEQY
jgi:type IV pilus assembly protein PilF